MNITVRKATESDIETIQSFGSKLLNFERENFDSSLGANWAFSEEAKEKYLAAIRDKYVTIAEMNSQPVGFLIGSIIIPKAGDARQIKQANLQNIYVDESQRHTGIGKALIENFKTFCKKERVNRLNVSVLATNETALRFYQKAGLTPRSINLSMNFTD